MVFIKTVFGIVASLVAFIIAIKLLALLLLVVGVALKLIWLAIVVGFFVLIAWIIYKIVSPQRAAQL